MKPYIPFLSLLLFLSSCQNNSESTDRNQVKKSLDPALTSDRFIPKWDTAGLTKKRILIEDDSVLASLDKNSIPQQNREESRPNNMSVTTQTFSQDLSADSKIIGEKGTVINLPALCLKDKNGETITGEVTFKLKEYYSASDLIKSHMGTTSNHQLLTTGGTINLEAYYRGDQLSIDQKNPLQILFPTGNRPIPGMRPFKGIQMKNGVNWVEDKGPKLAEHLCIDETIIHYPEFDGLVGKNGKCVEENFSNYFKDKTPQLDDDFFVNVNYAVTPMGKIMHVEVTSRHCPEEVENLVKDYFSNLSVSATKGVTTNPFWTHITHRIGATQEDRDYAQFTYKIPASFGALSYLNKPIIYSVKNEFYRDPRTNNQFYSIPMRNFGLLNCDAYSRDKRPKSNIIVYTPNFLNSTSLLVIPGKRGIIPCTFYDKKNIIKNIPVGEPCYLVTTNHSEGELFANITPITVHDNHTEQVKLKKMSKETFEKEMAVLDKLFDQQNSMAELIR